MAVPTVHSRPVTPTQGPTQDVLDRREALKAGRPSSAMADVRYEEVAADEALAELNQQQADQAPAIPVEDRVEAIFMDAIYAFNVTIKARDLFEETGEGADELWQDTRECDATCQNVETEVTSETTQKAVQASEHRLIIGAYIERHVLVTIRNVYTHTQAIREMLDSQDAEASEEQPRTVVADSQPRASSRPSSQPQTPRTPVMSLAQLDALHSSSALSVSESMPVLSLSAASVSESISFSVGPVADKAPDIFVDHCDAVEAAAKINNGTISVITLSDELPLQQAINDAIQVAGESGSNSCVLDLGGHLATSGPVALRTIERTLKQDPNARKLAFFVIAIPKSAPKAQFEKLASAIEGRDGVNIVREDSQSASAQSQSQSQPSLSLSFSSPAQSHSQPSLSLETERETGADELELTSLTPKAKAQQELFVEVRTGDAEEIGATLLLQDLDPMVAVLKGTGRLRNEIEIAVLDAVLNKHTALVISPFAHYRSDLVTEEQFIAACEQVLTTIPEAADIPLIVIAKPVAALATSESVAHVSVSKDSDDESDSEKSDTAEKERANRVTVGSALFDTLGTGTL